jgi:hypothetical protein
MRPCWPKRSHSVRVCIIHQNTKLMFNAIQDKGFRYRSTEECVLMHQNACFFNTCELCPTIEDFKTMLETCLNESRIEYIHYHNWATVDKCPLREMIAPIDEFSEEFGNLLVK